MNYVIYTDGGSRGNPGHSGIGIYLPDLEKSYGEYIGLGTNNAAEYQAMIFGLKKLKHLIGSTKAKEAHVEVRSDSNLIVNQLEGHFKVKEEDLFKYFIEIWNLKQEFGSVRWTYVPREQNSVADRVVNEALDVHLQQKLL